MISPHARKLSATVLLIGSLAAVTPLAASAPASSEPSPAPVAPAGKLSDQIGSQGSDMGRSQAARAGRTGAPVFPAPADPQAQQRSQQTQRGMAPGGSASSRTLSGPILGQDVSSWNAGVDFTKEKALGSRFAYIKTTEGQKDYANPEFSKQWISATNAGLPRGAYHFALPNRSDGATQADYFINNGGGWTRDGMTMPGLLDLEWNPYPALGNMCFNMTKAQMRTWITAFQDRYFARVGRYPAIYTATLWWNTCVGALPTASRSPLHLASYASEVGPMPQGTGWTKQDIWQYADSGTFKGDQNVFAGTEGEFASFINDPSYVPLGARSTTPVPVPTVSPLKVGDVVALNAVQGTVYAYEGGTASLVRSRVIFPKGWAGAISVHKTDWNKDGIFDILTQWKNGQLTVHYGKADGTFGSQLTIGGAGWQKMEITVGQYAVGDRFDSVIAMDSTTGRLLRYPGNGGALSTATLIGRGWSGLHPRLVQTDGIGAQEIVAKFPDGTLRIYRRYNSGAFVGSNFIVGYGWNIFNQLAAAEPGGNAFLARTTDGKVRRYDFAADRPNYVGVIGLSGWIDYRIGGSSVF